MTIVLALLLLFCFLIIPLFLTILNILFLVSKKRVGRIYKIELIIEQLTLFLGTIFSLLYLSFSEILNMDWQQVLRNNERHTPIAGDYQLTIVVLLGVGIVGYFLLRYVKTPPLLTVLGISFIYIGSILAISWILQVIRFNSLDIYLTLLPINSILIGAKAIKMRIFDWQSTHLSESLNTNESKAESFLSRLSFLLNQSHYWLGISFLLMLPILGIILCILVLFGQQPDSFIKAWTQTSQWNLSQKTSPPNVQFDEHYLCTVAAGGHKKLVKPQRMGIRHGHRVVVNRQLCIANAFEQIIEERIPRTHKLIRKIYDTYGFPLARLIRSAYAADIVYLLMKPAEYFFLFILYLVDVHPENRIALQYISKPQN